jgi:hypothetical protein
LSGAGRTDGLGGAADISAPGLGAREEGGGGLSTFGIVPLPRDDGGAGGFGGAGGTGSDDCCGKGGGTETPPMRVVRSAAARASVTARRSSPACSAASAARRNQRSASRRSPFSFRACAVSRLVATCSESDARAGGMVGVCIVVSTTADAMPIPI